LFKNYPAFNCNVWKNCCNFAFELWLCIFIIILCLICPRQQLSMIQIVLHQRYLSVWLSLVFYTLHRTVWTLVVTEWVWSVGMSYKILITLVRRRTVYDRNKHNYVRVRNLSITLLGSAKRAPWHIVNTRA